MRSFKWVPIAVAVFATHAGARETPPRTTTPLPRVIQRYLVARGCVPVTGRPRCEAFRGHFIRSTQTDWAVSCRDDSTLRLFVFDGGSTERVDEVVHERLERPDSSAGLSRCRFWREGTEVVRYFREAWAEEPFEEGDKPSSFGTVTHDGIEDSVSECCSVFHYWDRGRWWRITGMD